VLAPEDREAVLGDFLEEYRLRIRSGDRAGANAGYWRELFLASPHFLRRRVEPFVFGRRLMMDTRSGLRQALLGLLLAGPALALVISGVLQSLGVVREGLGPDAAVTRPIVILGGLLLAFVVNARPVFRLDIRREPQALVGTVKVRGRLWNLLSIGLALALLGTILGYAFVENFRLVPTHVTAAYDASVTGALFPVSTYDLPIGVESP
jgi:hypothetical protein